MSITATYVKSLNGYSGSHPFTKEDGVNIDASDIHETASTGDTVETILQRISQNVRMLTLEEMATDGDFSMRIGNYPLVINH